MRPKGAASSIRAMPENKCIRDVCLHNIADTAVCRRKKKNHQLGWWVTFVPISQLHLGLSFTLMMNK